jgi:hypothetical protein
MRRRSSRCLPAIAYAVLALSAGTASAQINPFPGTDLALSDSDLSVIEEVAGGLIGGKVVPTGTKLQWFNGETHRRGTIEVLGSGDYDGRPCHKLRYTLPIKSPAKTRAYDLNWCKTPDGDWKTVAK